MTVPKIYVRRKHGAHVLGGSLVVTTKWQGIDAERFPDTLLSSDPAIEVETEAEHKARRPKKGDDAGGETTPDYGPSKEGES